MFVIHFFYFLYYYYHYYYYFILFYFIFIYFFFVTAVCQARIYSLCFIKKSDDFFPANSLLLIVIDR